MSTPSSPGSSASAAITIAEAFAYCRTHPVEGVDLERFLGIFVSTPACIVDAREYGLLGIVMDRLATSDGAKPFEWIGGPTSRISPAVAPALIEQVMATARGLALTAIDLTLHGHWATARAELTAAGAEARYVDVEMTRPEGARRVAMPLPAGWRWEPVVPAREAAYYDLLRRSLGPMPGVYIPPEAEAIASMRTTADGTRVLLDQTSRARAVLRCKLEKRYIHLLARCPEMKGRGLGALCLDEAARLMGPGPLHLSVVKQNRVAHAFYLRNGFVPTGEVETWQLRIMR